MARKKFLVYEELRERTPVGMETKIHKK